MTRWGGGGQDVVGWGTRRGETGDNKSWWREGQNKVGMGTRQVGGRRQDMVWGQDVMGRVTRRGGKVDKRVDF